MSTIDRRESTGRIGRAAGAALVGLGLVLSACGSATGSSGDGGLRLGYLPNLTHAPALIGVEQNIFSRRLGPGAPLHAETVNAGPQCLTALVAGSLDACFSGPSPAVNAFVKSNGSAVRIVAGATSGGAGLVVRPASGITTPGTLRGRVLATPQLGNTQDVALRAYLRSHGIATDPQGGGDTKIVATDNASILQLFRQGHIDGAWVPEPFVSRLEHEAGGHLLVDEASLWPGGQFATTLLVVSSAYLGAHPQQVRALIEGEAEAVALTVDHPSNARSSVQRALHALNQKTLPAKEFDAAWSRLTFTLDPLAASLRRSADEAHAAGLLASEAHLAGICDLRLVNAVLRGRGLPPVAAAGLGPG